MCGTDTDLYCEPVYFHMPITLVIVHNLLRQICYLLFLTGNTTGKRMAVHHSTPPQPQFIAKFFDVH